MIEVLEYGYNWLEIDGRVTQLWSTNLILVTIGQRGRRETRNFKRGS